MCPHSGDVYCFIGGTPEKHGDLTVVFQYFFTGELIHTVVSCIQTEVVCVVKGGRGEILVNMRHLKVFSRCF